MTIAKLLLVCGMVLAPCAALHARYGWSTQRSLAFTLCAQSLSLYSFGLFLPFSCCVALLCVICLLCAGYFFLHTGLRRRLAGFLSAPTILFVLGMPLLYYACCDRRFLSYDEYSHWGLMIKLISVYDALPRAGAGAPLLLYNYPPAGAMVPALCASIFGYREGVAYFGYALLLWGLLLGLVPEKGGALFQTLSAAALFLCLMALFPFALLRLFSEPLIALCLALLVLYAWAGEHTRGEWARTAVLTVFLSLTKNSAPVFVAMYLLVRVSMRADRREWKRSALLAACGAAAYFSYVLYCRVHGIESAFTSQLSANVHALLNGTLDAVYRSAPERFLRHFFTARFPQIGISFTYGFGTSAAVLYGCVLALCAVQAMLSRARRHSVRMWIGVWAGMAGYMAFILVGYMLIFTPEESQVLSEFYRYASLPALWMALLACALLLRRAGEMSPCRRGITICALTLCLAPLSHPVLIYDTLVTYRTTKKTIREYAPTRRLETFLRAQLDLTQTPRIRLMGECNQMALRYELLDAAELGSWADSWTMGEYAGTLEGVRAHIEQGGYDYVLIGETESEEERKRVDARYAPLFAGGAEAIHGFSLYRVVREDGIRLEYIATADEE